MSERRGRSFISDEPQWQAVLGDGLVQAPCPMKYTKGPACGGTLRPSEPLKRDKNGRPIHVCNRCKAKLVQS